MRLIYKQMLIVSMLLLLNACGRQEEWPSERVAMPLTICLPSNETGVLGGPARRMMGDAGTTEHFLLPNYIYIIILKQDGENWTVWQSVEREVAAEKWEKKRYVGNLQTMGDSIYQFSEQLEFILSNQRFNGRVYAMASAVPLTFNQSLNTLTDLDDVLALTFSTASGTVQQNLQHIYSTPYNYCPTGSYYGSFSSITHKMPQVNLMLYHVASKVDIQWYVAESVRIKADPAEAVRLTYMEAQHLFNGNAYCFQPMRNELAAKVSTGYTIADMITPTDEGLWWEGRTYFYTIPYTVTGDADYFPLQMRLRTNGSSDTYCPTLNMRVDTSDVFVPWIRMNFNLSQPLEDKSETKVVEN
jgi:hypothetical protein